MKPRQFGPYQLVKYIARGGMADIYLAKTAGIEGFEKYLALKMIRENLSDDHEFVEMLVNEANLAVLLNHPNIVNVFDLGQIEGIYYLAMEFVEGNDLHALLVDTAKNDTYVPFEVAAYIIAESCAGLDYVHTRTNPEGQPLAIVHRDISPQNILLGYGGEVKIADFGIAKANVSRTDTQVGILKGKFCYMSPEQAWGDKLDNRSDVFSLGVVLHEMLTGEMLYQEEDQLRLLEQVRRAQVPLPRQIRREVPSELEAITMLALERDKKERFNNAAELQRELTKYLNRVAPGFTRADLVRYLQSIFKPVTSSSPRDVSQETRNVRLDLMAKNEFIPSGAGSLVFGYGQLQQAAKQAQSAREPEDSTRQIGLPSHLLEEEDAPSAVTTQVPKQGQFDAAFNNNDYSGFEDDEYEPTVAYTPDELRFAIGEVGAPVAQLIPPKPEISSTDSTAAWKPPEPISPTMAPMAQLSSSPTRAEDRPAPGAQVPEDEGRSSLIGVVILVSVLLILGIVALLVTLVYL